MVKFKFAAFLFFLISASAFVHSQDLSGEELDVRLFVIGQGDAVYSYWGHTGLAIRDNINERDVFFDFGNFYFGDDNFFTNFAIGRLLYIAYANYTESYTRSVLTSERNMTEYVLNLSPDAKTEMYNALIEKSRPENRTYLYHNYFDNCSTRIRDYIDRAVGGELKRQTEMRGSSTYRESFLRFTSHNKLVGSALSILQGQPIDEKISLWEEMFLPAVMGDVVSELTYRDARGREIPLVNEINILNKVDYRKPVPSDYERPFLSTLLISLFLSGFVFFLNLRSLRGKRALFAALNIITGLVVGILGCALLFLAAFTDHSYSYNNLNLFMLNPLALFIIPAAILYGRKGGNWRKRLDILWMIQLGSTVLMIAIKAFTPLKQDNLIEIMIFLPLLTAFGPLIPHGLRKLNLLRKLSDSPGETGNAARS